MASQETEEALERRRVMEQDQPVDITFIPKEIDPTQAKADQAYSDFISQDPDGDDNEAFYPPPEFEADCEFQSWPPLAAPGPCADLVRALRPQTSKSPNRRSRI